MKKMTCSVLALLMAISPLSAFASAEIPIVPPGNTPVTLNTTPLTFNATVPTGLPLNLAANGVVTPATEASIINNSIGPIKVVSVTTEAVEGWKLTNYTDDFSTKKVNSKDIALQFNKDNVQSSGGIALTPQNWPTIAGSDSLRLDYQGKLAPQSTGFTADTAANVSFVLDWDDTPISETDIEDTSNPEYSFTVGDIKTINFSFKNSKTDKVVFTSSNPEVATVELVDNSNLRLVSGIKAAKITAISNGTTTITGTLEDGTSSSIEVVVTDKAVKGLVVKSPASKTSYIEGEDFDATGLVIEAINNNGTSDIVTNYTLSNNTNLAANQTEVILSYNGHEISLPITVAYNYILATDADFSGIVNSTSYSTALKYIGTDKYVEVPHVIKGIPVTSYYEMFADTSVEGVKSTNTNVTNMSYMFKDSQATTLDLSSLDTSKVTNMSVMFNWSQATTLDLSGFDTSNVTDMSWMFNGSKATTLDLSSFDTSNVTNMQHMFDMSQATTLDVSSFDTSKVKYMMAMFSYSSATILDLSSFDTSNVTSMRDMFNGSKATTLDLSSFDTSNVTDMSVMFARSPATTLDLSNFDTANVTSMDAMFNGSKATTLDLSSFDTSKVTSMNSMFNGSPATTLDLSSFDTSKVTSMNSMFNGSQATTLDLSEFDTSNVTNMSQMFSHSQATTIDLSNFNTSKVTNMSHMFGFSQATTLDLSSFDTSKVTSMRDMFNGSQATTLDLSNFNTANVTSMSGMFTRSKETTLDLSSFDTSNVTNMNLMFYKSQATILDLSNFNTSNVTDMSSMFSGSQATTLDLSSFDTSNVTNINKMFEGSLATTGYARTQTDANKFNASTDKPAALTFRVK